MRSFVAVLPLAAALCTAGCMGTSATILDGAGLRYPVSLSKSIVDGSGRHYTPSEAETVAHFERQWSHWEMFFGKIQLSSDVVLANVLHEEIEAAEGDGIVNLTLRANGSILGMYAALFLVVPTHVTVTIEGDVIRRTRP